MPTPHAATRPIGYAAYKLDGCRCYGCALACSQYRAQVERMKAEGAWQPFVDAEPVRQHLGFLSRHGIGWRRACHLAGVSTGADTNAIARRLGISRNYLEKARERTGAPSPGVAEYLAAKAVRPREIQP